MGLKGKKWGSLFGVREESRKKKQAPCRGRQKFLKRSTKKRKLRGIKNDDLEV